MGAVTVGVGVIGFVAANWDGMSNSGTAGAADGHRRRHIRGRLPPARAHGLGTARRGGAVPGRRPPLRRFPLPRRTDVQRPGARSAGAAALGRRSGRRPRSSSARARSPQPSVLIFTRVGRVRARARAQRRAARRLGRLLRRRVLLRRHALRHSQPRCRSGSATTGSRAAASWSPAGASGSRSRPPGSSCFTFADAADELDFAGDDPGGRRARRSRAPGSARVHHGRRARAQAVGRAIGTRGRSCSSP